MAKDATSPHAMLATRTAAEKAVQESNDEKLDLAHYIRCRGCLAADDSHILDGASMSRHPDDIPDFLRRDANNRAPWMDQKPIEPYPCTCETCVDEAAATEPAPKMPWDG